MTIQPTNELEQKIEDILKKYMPPEDLSGYITTDCDCYEKAYNIHGAKLKTIRCEHQRLNLSGYVPRYERVKQEILAIITSRDKEIDRQAKISILEATRNSSKKEIDDRLSSLNDSEVKE